MENLLHSIELPAGWSYFSTYLCPFESNMENIMLDLVDSGDLIIVKNDNGDVYWPTFNINGIGDVINGKAYFISALKKEKIDDLKKNIFKEIRKIHIKRYPFNNHFLN